MSAMTSPVSEGNIWIPRNRTTSVLPHRTRAEYRPAVLCVRRRVLEQSAMHVPQKRQRMRDRPAWMAARHRNAMSRWAYDRTRTHSTPAFEGGPETRFGPRPERPAERRIQAGLRPGYPSPPSTRTRGRRRTDGMRGMFHDGGSRVHEPMRMLRKTRLRRLCSSERIRRTNLLPMLGR